MNVTDKVKTYAVASALKKMTKITLGVLITNTSYVVFVIYIRTKRLLKSILE